MAEHLKYDSATGHLVYEADGGHLVHTCGSCPHDGTACSNCDDTNAQMQVVIADLTPCPCDDPDITGCPDNGADYSWGTDPNDTHTLDQDGTDPCLWTKIITDGLEYNIYGSDTPCSGAASFTDNLDIHIHLTKSGAGTAELIVFGYTDSFAGTNEFYVLLFYDQLTGLGGECDGPWDFTNEVDTCNDDPADYDNGYMTSEDYEETGATGGTATAECITS